MPLLDCLLGRPRLVLLLLFLPVLLVGVRAPFTPQDNSPETFFSADRQAHETYRRMVRTFGGDELVLVDLQRASLDRPRDVQALAELARRLETLPGVRAVFSAADGLPELTGGGPPDLEELAPLQREVEALPFYRQLGLVRPEVPALAAAAVIVMEGAGARRRFNESLGRITEPLARQGYVPLVAGLTPANAAIDRETRRATGRFLPLVALAALLAGLLVFRSPGALLAMALPVAGAVAVGAGLLELSGQSVNLVTGVMPPLVLAIGFAGAVHLVSRYGGLVAGGMAPDAAVRKMAGEKLRPTALAFLTTAVGFGSLAVSPVQPVRVLGLAAAAALLAALLLVALGTPCLLLLLRPRVHHPAHRRRLLQELAALSIRRRPLALLLVALAALPVMSGALRLQTSIDGVALLGDGIPEKRALLKLQAEGLGLNAVDLWIRQPVPDAAALLRAARPLQAMARELSGNPLVTGSVGMHQLLEVFQWRSAGRGGLPESLDALDLLDPPQRQQALGRLGLFWSPTGGLKLTLLCRTVTAGSLEALKGAVAAAAARHFPGKEVLLSGHFMMLIGTPGMLMDTLVESLGMSAAIIALLFLAVLRSPGLALAGMAVNLLPVGVAVGLMGWLDIPVDVATVMTGSVAFGLAVDDTFHYLYHLKASGGIVRAAGVVGQGMVATSLMIISGFAVLGTSGFTPTVRFGLLTAFALAVALVADAVLLPALVGRREELE